MAQATLSGFAIHLVFIISQNKKRANTSSFFDRVPWLRSSFTGWGPLWGTFGTFLIENPNLEYTDIF